MKKYENKDSNFDIVVLMYEKQLQFQKFNIHVFIQKYTYIVSPYLMSSIGSWKLTLCETTCKETINNYTIG